MNCPACGHGYDPHTGNVPAKGTFVCSCGNRDKIIESIRLLPQTRRLPVRPYAIQAYLKPHKPSRERMSRESLFEDGAAEGTAQYAVLPDSLLPPKNGKFFKRFSASDRANFQRAENLWNQHKMRLPYPKSRIPKGAETARLLEHHYNHWHDMFAPRQLLALATLLNGVMAEKDDKLREMLLCAFSNTLEGNNMFVRNIPSRKTPGGTAPAGVFARHDYQPKTTICEQNVWGTESGNNTFLSRMKMLKRGIEFRKSWPEGEHSKSLDSFKGTVTADIRAESSDRLSEEYDESPDVVVTDPPYVGNVNYSELADFFHVWLRLAFKGRYPWFAPEITPKGEEIIENRVRERSREDFYARLSSVFRRIHEGLPADGLLIFTFHHTDREGTIWEGLLQALCDVGFEIAAVYPIHAEREQALNLQDKENVAYDLIHVCRKRRENPSDRSWAGVRQEVRRRARAELAAIEAGRYGNQPLPEPDVRLVCIGKCLELYSAHYDRVLDHEGNPLPLHQALQDIGAIVDQLVTRERPLPPELEDIDALSYAWLRLLMPVRGEVGVDKVNKGLRAMQVNTEDLRKAGLIIRGRAGRGRTYEVKQPLDRLEDARKRLQKAYEQTAQSVLFQDDPALATATLPLVDLLHALIALADAGEQVLPWLERFPGRQAALRAGLRFLRDERADWSAAIDRVLAIIEGAPLFNPAGAI